MKRLRQSHHFEDRTVGLFDGTDNIALRLGADIWLLSLDEARELADRIHDVIEAGQ